MGVSQHLFSHDKWHDRHRRPDDPIENNRAPVAILQAAEQPAPAKAQYPRMSTFSYPKSGIGLLTSGLLPTPDVDQTGPRREILTLAV